MPPPKQLANRALIEPRLLSKADAANYLGMTPRNYDRLRLAGKVPGYVPSTHRIDKLELDAAIDSLKLAAAHLTFAAPEPEDFFAVWRKKRAERKAREALEDEAIRRGVDVVTTPDANGRTKTTYIHRTTGRRLPYDPKHPKFRAAFARYEEEAKHISKPTRSRR